ncbi:MAG: helix-turn-helix domain-containing protein [Duncaniella sp.]|nr:helix-turn-helix domain-containing protein [Duncaniella sp.]
MNENLYMLADNEICRRIGEKIRYLRLRQNITQMSLAEQSQISVSTVKKIENGEIGSFDSLMRVLRILGELDIFSPLLKEEDMSPNEYLELVEANRKKQRKRANSTNNINTSFNQEESEW